VRSKADEMAIGQPDTAHGIKRKNKEKIKTKTE